MAQKYRICTAYTYNHHEDLISSYAFVQFDSEPDRKPIRVNAGKVVQWTFSNWMDTPIDIVWNQDA